MSSQRLTIICVAYRRPEPIRVLIHSFLAQTLQNWHMHIIHDGPDAEMEKLLQHYANEYPDKLTITFTPERFNDYGHSLRDIGIQSAEGEFLLLTNDDNYYVPVFLEYMFNVIEAHSADFVMCDMVHSHENPGGRQQGSYTYFETYPQHCGIDMGCFIVRTEMAKAVGFKDKSWDGDSAFVKDIIDRFKDKIRIGKIDKILFVHN